MPPDNGLASMKAIPTRTLLQHYARILDELRSREVITTRDSPVGGYGQWLVCRAFDALPNPNSSKGFDVLTSDGVRIEVKTRWMAEPDDSRQLGSIRNLDRGLFDQLAAILLSEDFGVQEAYLIPHRTIVKLARYVRHTNSMRIVLTPAICADPEVEDITERVRRALPE